MFITKMALPRRTFLRGLGATIALPLLDAMVPAFSAIVKTAANPARRLGFLYLPNGVGMNHTGVNYWKPKSTGKSFEFSPILTPLAPYRDQVVVISGLCHPQAESLGNGAGDHTRGTATWLNGVHPVKTEGAAVRAGTTADQMAAAELGKETPIPSLELTTDINMMAGNCDGAYSCTYMNTLSWRTPTTPLPTESNPRAVFERLFGDGGTPAQRLAELRKDRSILDSVTEELNRFHQGLGPSDRARTDEYFEAIREVERRIQRVEKGSADAEPVPGIDRPPVGIPTLFADHVNLMLDLQWLAYQADLTRVFTFMFGREISSRIYPELGLTEGHHAISHHGDNPENILKLAKLNTHQTDLFASFLEKLRSTPDGDGSLLDHSLLLYGAGLSNPDIHSHVDLPLLVIGGEAVHLKGGRHLAYPAQTPMTNLLVSMLDKVGVPVESVGDSTGRLNLNEPLPDV